MGANEKHAATYHGGEYTPTTEPVRNAYAAHLQNCYPVTTDALNEFDRWLETVRAEAKAEALREAAAQYPVMLRDMVTRRSVAEWLQAKAQEAEQTK